MANLKLNRRLLRNHMLQSALINAGLSLAFFIAVFGASGSPLHWSAPDHLARDFLPQCGMIGLMSALVPALIARREFAAANTAALRPASKIIGLAILLALVALAIGGAAALLALALPVSTIDVWPALALKMLLGGALGSAFTLMALRPMIPFARSTR